MMKAFVANMQHHHREQESAGWPWNDENERTRNSFNKEAAALLDRIHQRRRRAGVGTAQPSSALAPATAPALLAPASWPSAMRHRSSAIVMRRLLAAGTLAIGSGASTRAGGTSAPTPPRQRRLDNRIPLGNQR